MSITIDQVSIPLSNKPVYPRTTKNFYYHDVGGLRVWFSYQTVIAIDHTPQGLMICRNVWSPTTARHLWWINSNHNMRMDYDDFQDEAGALLKGSNLLAPDPAGMFGTIANISRIFSVMESSNDPIEQRKNNNQRLRFYEAGALGITRPHNWDDLTVEDQHKRLDKLDESASA